jgi:hypothetical protein
MPVDNYSSTRLLDRGRALSFGTILEFETRFFCIQMSHLKQLLFLVIALFVLGCQSDENTPIDPFHLPPFVKSFTISPSSVNTDTINVGQQRLPTDTLRITVNATAQVSDPEGISNLREVSVGVYRPKSQDLIKTAPLFDNGIAPDAIAGDGTFTGVVAFNILRSDIGDFRVEVTATNKTELSSNSVSVPLAVVRLNKPPMLSDLTAPDSVSIGSPYLLFTLTIRANDPDGLGDIQKVFFNSFRPDGSPATNNPFQMYDDGSESQIFPAPVFTSGDAVKGDGVYTLKIILFPNDPLTGIPTQRGVYRFEFQATDRSGAVSNTIVHNLTVE